jgi:hypothetical protein
MQVSSIIGIDVGGGESNLDLNQVLTNGNISTQDAKVGGIFAYNPHLGSGLGYVSITGDKNRFNFYSNTNQLFGQLQQDSIFLKNSSNASGLFISKPTTVSANRIATFQDADGTIAYLSNIPLGRVPYTGATQSVNLGSNDIYTQGNARLADDGTVYGTELFVYDSANGDHAVLAYNDDIFTLRRPSGVGGSSMITCENGTFFTLNNGTANATIVNPLTVSRNYTLPNASGTFALTSDLVGLTGYVTVTTTQTISGAKTFTNNITINGSSGSNMFFQTNGSGTGTITSSASFFQFDAFNSSGYAFKNGSSANVLTIDQNGTTAFLSLTGSGTRMVVANATGQLSTQTISDLSGFVTLATTQTISAPSKTFTNPVTVGSTATVVYTTIGQNYVDIRNGNETTVGWIRHVSNGCSRFKNGFSTNLLFADPTVNTTLNLPAKTAGTYTIATVEDLTGFVTLGTAQTITGLKTFTSSLKIANTTNPSILNFEVNTIATGNISSNGTWFQLTANNTTGYLFKNTSLINTLALDQNGNAAFLGSVSHRPLGETTNWVSQLGSDTSGALRRGALRLREMSNGTGFVANVIPTDLTTDRTYTLPDATGTIALTSDLTGFVTLATTQTISGAKTFTNNIQVTSTGSPTMGFDVSGTLRGSMSIGTSFFQFNAINTSGYLFKNSSNVNTLTLDQLGNATFLGQVTAAGFFNSSDARLKNVIERDGDTVKFTWKDKRDDKTHIGYIAQEVQEKYPDQVNENEDGMLTVNYIEVLVAKIQELENRIKQLEK